VPDEQARPAGGPDDRRRGPRPAAPERADHPRRARRPGCASPHRSAPAHRHRAWAFRGARSRHRAGHRVRPLPRRPVRDLNPQYQRRDRSSGSGGVDPEPGGSHAPPRRLPHRAMTFTTCAKTTSTRTVGIQESPPCPCGAPRSMKTPHERRSGAQTRGPVTVVVAMVRQRCADPARESDLQPREHHGMSPPSPGRARVGEFATTGVAWSPRTPTTGVRAGDGAERRP